MFAFLLNELQHLGQKYLWTWSGWFDHVDCLDGSFAYPAKDKQITGRVSKRLPTRCSESFRGFAQHRERDFSHFRHFSFFFFFLFPLSLRFYDFFFFFSPPLLSRGGHSRNEHVPFFVETFDQIVGEINDEHEFILREMIRKGGRGGKKEDGTYYKVSRCC